MKKRILFFVVVLLSTSIFTSCKSDEPSIDINSPKKIGVEINGVVWSPYNVGATGKFVSNPEEYGGLYQWNLKDTSNFLLNDTYFPSGLSSATSWLFVNDPSPKDWRIPTFDEMQTLLDSEKVENEWTTENGINGRRFIDKTTGNSIFLPIGGYRSQTGEMYAPVGGNYGYYWSSIAEDNALNANAFCLAIYINIAEWGITSKASGLSVRPIAK